MTFEIIESEGHPIKAWTRGVQVEEQAKQQLRHLTEKNEQRDSHE